MKKEEKTEITKEKILSAAQTEFGTNGFAASVNDICKKHGISKGLIYHNFESKEALYLHCVQRAADDFIAYMQAQEIGTDLQRYMQIRYAFFRENPHCARLIFEVPAPQDTPFGAAIQKTRAPFDNFNLSLYHAVLAQLTLREGITEADAVHYYTLLQNMLNCYTSLQGATEDFGDRFLKHETQLQKILEYMLYGIAKK